MNARITSSVVHHEIGSKIAARSARVGVIGLGYVGLPLSLLYVGQGLPVTGFDIDQRKVDMLGTGKSYIYRIPEEEIQEARAKRFTATSDFSQIAEMDAIDQIGEDLARHLAGPGDLAARRDATRQRTGVDLDGRPAGHDAAGHGAGFGHSPVRQRQVGAAAKPLGRDALDVAMPNEQNFRHRICPCWERIVADFFGLQTPDSRLI